MRSPTPKTWLMAGLVAVAAASPMRPAVAAKKRVVVLEVRGTLSEDLQAVLVRLLSNDHRVISSAEYDKLAQQMRAVAISDKNVARVAKKLAAEGVLHGWITTTDDDRLLLRLRLRNGATGKVVKKLAILVDSEKLSGPVRAEIKKRLLAAIDQLAYVEVDTDVKPSAKTKSRGRVETRSGSGKGGAKSPARKTKSKGKGKPAPEPVFDDGDDENPLAPQGGKKGEASAGGDSRVAEVSDQELEIRDTGGDRDPAGAAAAGSRELVGAAVDVGLSVMSRTLGFDSRPELADAPAGYQGPLVPALHLGAEIYPGLLDQREGVLSRIGAGVVIDRVFGLQTAVEGTASLTLPTTQMRYGVDVRYRQPLGKPVVTASIGLSRLQFEVAKETAPAGVVVDVPNTAYTYLDPGVAVALPVADRVEVAAHAKVLLVMDAGEVQSVEQYGAGTVTGFDLELGGSYAVTRELTLAASLSYLGFAFDFHGTGELATSRDDDPSTVDVEGASDRYLAGYLTASYAL